MAKIVSSYCTKVVGEEKIFRSTVCIYRAALSFLMKVVNDEWDCGLSEVLQKSSKKAQRAVELLVHAAKGIFPSIHHSTSSSTSSPATFAVRPSQKHWALFPLTVLTSNGGRMAENTERLPKCRLPPQRHADLLQGQHVQGWLR